MAIQITLQSQQFRIAFPYSAALVAAVKSLPSRRWDAAARVWTVPAADGHHLRTLLSRLTGVTAEYGAGAREALDAAAQQATTAIAESRAADFSGEIPAPEGLSYLPYQRAGIAYALSRPSTLIGDEMGLGKTIQAIGVANADATVRSVLVICPASLKINWVREWTRWAVRPATVAIANGSLPETDVVVVNYDVLKKHTAAIRARQWDLLIVDEAHYLKSPKAQRTVQVLGRWDRDPAKIVPAIAARRRVFLTGTPILNRPVELWPLVRALDPQGLGRGWQSYVTRYCNGHQTRFGWDVSGSSNLTELQDRLRSSVLVRRLKADVLADLPPKRRSVIALPADGLASVIRAEEAGYAAAQARVEAARVAVELAKAESDEAYASAIAALNAASGVAFAEIARVRHDTAVAKVPAVVAYLRDATEAGKVVVFAHHHDVIDALRAEFPEAVSLTGRDSQEARQHAVDQFQTNQSCKLFIGSIQAAGVGITLTAASHVVFAELDWVPGNVSQAEDRCHRIGQCNHVVVDHLVLDGSLDVRLARTLVEKQSRIDSALDDAERAELGAIEIAPDAPVTASATRKQIAAEAESLSPAEVATVHAALRTLAELCDGANAIDGAGFNKIDSRLGKSLAALETLSPRQAALGRKICRKYHRQIGKI